MNWGGVTLGHLQNWNLKPVTRSKTCVPACKQIIQQISAKIRAVLCLW